MGAETSEVHHSIQILEGRLKVEHEEGDKAMQALVVATQQELAEEKDMCLAETTELRGSLQTLEGCLTQHLQDLKLTVDEERCNGIRMHDCLAEYLNQMKAAVNAQETRRLQASYEMNDKVKRLSGDLESVKRKCAAADDEITALKTVVKNAIEKEQARQEKTDNHIKTQINNVRRELIDHKGERDNECSMLKRLAKNSYEAEVNKRSMARERLEQTHGGLDAHDTNHLEAYTGLENMIEQEIKVREKDTCNTERALGIISARFDTEYSKMSENMNNLNDRLKRLSDELGTEVQDRMVGDAAVRALVVATQQELGNEKDLRLAETNTTRCNLQSLEERLKLDREESDKAVYALVVAMQEFANEQDMHLAEATELQGGFERRLELLREGCFQLENEVYDDVHKLGAMHKGCLAADDAIISRTGTTLSLPSQASTGSLLSEASETSSITSEYFQTV